MIKLVQQYLINHPELLKPQYRVNGKHPLYGHCYVACEALYHLKYKTSGYRPYVVRVGNITHWYLRNLNTGSLVDPTGAQFEQKPIPYHNGRCCGFLTKAPSKRAKQVIRAMAKRI